MISLHYPKHFQPLQRLSFCYLCGEPFDQAAKTNRDHVPPKALFAAADRIPLILRTHVRCNNEHNLTDEKMGQLVGLRRGVIPPRNTRRLEIETFGNRAAVTNVDVHGAIWRWIRGFHAALYQEPLALDCKRAIELPFQRAQRSTSGRFQVVPLREAQHRIFVALLKTNRAHRNIDRIVSNSGKMTYECVWAQNGPRGEWACVFGLDVYAWKDLGDPTLGRRGCAGVYTMPSGEAPPMASKAASGAILVPNYDPLDPFGR